MSIIGKPNPGRGFKSTPRPGPGFIKPGPYVVDAGVDKNMINKLFTSVSDGDINKIKEVVAELKIPLNVKNDKGETLINSLMRIETISVQDKIELIEYLTSNGVSLSQDNDGMTPLHVAAKYQDRDFVKALIKNYHMIKSIDNKDMNAIHYAVLCQMVDCDKPKSLEETEVSPFENLLRQSAGIIIDMFNLDPIKKYVKIISSSSKNFGWYKNSQIKSYLTEHRENILRNIGKGNLAQLTDDTIKTTYANIKQELIGNWKCFDNIEIDISRHNIWGPIKNSQFKLMKNDKDTLIKEFYNFDTIDKTYSEFNNAKESLFNSIHDFDNYIKKNIIRNTYDIAGLMSFYDKITINKPPLPSGGQLTPNFSVFFETAQIQCNFVDLLPINVNYNYNYINHATFEAPKIYFCSKSAISRISKIYKKDPDALLVAMRPGKRPLVNNNNPNIGNMFYKDYFDKRQQFDHIANSDAIDTNNFVDSKNFLIRFSSYTCAIYENMKLIGEYIKYIDDSIKQNSTVYIFTHILPMINIFVLNIIQNSIAINYFSKLYPENKTIFIAIDTEINKYQFLINTEYKFVYEQMLSRSKSMKSSFENVTIEISKIYDNCVHFINSINKYIVSIQNKIGITIFTEFLTDPTVLHNHNDVFERELLGIPQLPTTFADYNKLYTFGADADAIENFNKILYEKYVIKINRDNYATYYNSQTPLATIPAPPAGAVSATIPFIVIQQVPPKVGFSFYPPANFSQNVHNPGLIRKNIANAAYTPNIDTNGIPGTPNAILNDANINLDGYLGYNNSSLQLQDLMQTNEHLPVHILGNAFDSIYVLFKHIIIRAIICAFSKLQNTQDVDDFCNDRIINIDIHNSHTQKIKIEEILTNFKKIFESAYTLRNDWEQYVYVAVGRITDRILTNMIKMNIHASLSETIMRELYNITRKSDYQLILQRHFANDRTHILELDKDIKFALDQFFKDLVSVYKEDDIIKINKLYPSNIYKKYDRIQGDTFTLYSDNYLDFNISANPCYCFDPEIIKILTTAGCDVNQQDILGHSPIFYAINMYNIKCVETLINTGAFPASVKNNTGLTPLTYALNILNKQVRLMKDLYLPKAYAKKTLTELDPKLKDYNNLIPIFIDNIYEYLFILCNFNIFVDMSDYKFGWTIEHENMLYNKLNVDIYGSILPFLNVSDNEINNITNNATKLNTINNLVEENSKVYETLQRKINDYEKQLKSLTDKLTEFTKIDVLTFQMVQEQTRKIKQHIEIQKILGYKPDPKNPQIPREQQYVIPPGYDPATGYIAFTTNNLPGGLYYEFANLFHFGNQQYHGDNIQISKLVRDNANDILNSNTLNTNLDTDTFDKIFFYLGKRRLGYLLLNTDPYNFDSDWDVYMEYLNPLNEYMLLASFINNYLSNSDFITKTMPEILISKIKDKVSKNIIDAIKTSNYDSINASFVDAENDLDMMISYYDMLIVQLDSNMPLIYNKGNIILDKAINNIIHVTRSTICTNIYYTIVKLIMKHLEKNTTESLKEIVIKLGINPKEIEDKPNYWLYNIPPKQHQETENSRKQYYAYLTTILENILFNNNYKEYRLDKYILVDLPRIAVKIILNEHFYSSDIDKGYKNINNAIDVIKYIILHNSVYPITPDSSIIKTLDEYLIPYFKDILTTFIPKLMSFIRNYHNYIRNSHNILQIIKLLLIHSKNEYKSILQ